MKKILLSMVLVIFVLKGACAEEYSDGWIWGWGTETNRVKYCGVYEGITNDAIIMLLEYVYSDTAKEWRPSVCGEYELPWRKVQAGYQTCHDWDGDVCDESFNSNAREEACNALDLFNSGLLLDYLTQTFPDGGSSDPNFEAIILDVVANLNSKEPAEQAHKNANNNTSKADPVHLSNGEYELTVTDFVIPARTMSVAFTRTYGSRREYNSQLGYGWDFNYNMKVRPLAPVSEEPNSVVLLSGGCYKRDFIQDTNDPNLYTRQDDLNSYISFDPVTERFTLIEKSGLQYNFNTNGCLWRITDENNNYVEIDYKDDELKDVYGHSNYFYTESYGGPENKYGLVAREYQIDTITDDLGRDYSFTYDANGLLYQITDFAGRIWVYSHDPLTNDLTTVQDPNGRITEYIYDLRHNLEQIKDPNGDIYITNDYDVYDKVDTQVYGNGTFIFDYNSVANYGILTDRQDYETRVDYTDSGQIDTETIYTSDPNADPNSFTTQYFYNTNNQVIRTILPDGNSIDYTYNSNGNLTGVYQKANLDDPNILGGGYTYDPNDPNVIGTEFTYDPNWPNKFKTVTDAMGKTTSYDYDGNGNLEKITYPTVGNETPIAEFAYNAYGQLDTAISVDGILTKYLYYPTEADVNNFGHLWKTIVDYNDTDANAFNITTEYEYDRVGNIIEITDPNSDITKFKYSPIDLLEETKNPLNQTTTYTYTPNKKVKTISRSLGAQTQTTTYAYDILDNLKSITGPLGSEYLTSYGYNKNEDPNIITDPNLNSTISEYDERGLLRSMTDANDNMTEYSYDKNGNLKIIIDPNDNITTYDYDPFGRLELITYPDDSNEIFSYDKNSNLLSKTNRAEQIISYEYDALNRLEVVNRPGEPNIVYTYDIAGRIYDVNDRGDITEFYYDRIGRVTDVNDPEDRLVSYDYDELSRRTELIYPDDSNVTYQYDAMSRLDKIFYNGTEIADYDYDALGRRTLLTLGNDANAIYDYDLGNRLTKLTNNLDDTNSITFAYDDYDLVGNRLSMKIDDANAHVYTYDEIYRLTFVDYNDGNSTSYLYDALSNWLETYDGTTLSFTSNNMNQYTYVGVTQYFYNNNGCLSNDGTYKYYYDCENRLIDVNDVNDAAVASYKYDYMGRRIEKTVYGPPNVTTKYCYDGQQVIAEYENNVLARKFIYGSGIDEPICMIDVSDGNEIYYYHFDGLGSVVALSDVNNVIVESYSYDVFGKPDTTSSVGNPYMFTARRLDSETANYYYRARIYDPNIGRFLQPDPIGYDDGLNMYAYVGNNPVNFFDPFGLCKEDSTNYFTLPNGQKIPAPAGYDPLRNAFAGHYVGILGFSDLVRPGTPMDYKRLGHINGEITHPEFENMGNFNYGFVGKAAGFTERRLLREAGRAARDKKTGKFAGEGYPGYFINPFGGKAPYGDTLEDQEMIKQGFEYYNQNLIFFDLIQY
ncbi:MAG: hypothetical protein KAS96_02030 [Planctomycetes bacterium]|nr:hypothetical protein [Planctomycetota bacterium]